LNSVAVETDELYQAFGMAWL